MANGKVKSIIRYPEIHNLPDIEYQYDAMGNRVSKLIKTRTGTALDRQDEWLKTYYVRDAQGNVMATYDRMWKGPATPNGGSGPQYQQSDMLTLSEQHIYGSSRLGVRRADLPIAKREVKVIAEALPPGTPYVLYSYSPTITTTLPNWWVSTYEVGKKKFELSNHLGNVLSVVSDNVWANKDVAGEITHFTPDIVAANDYYPFGMQMPGRNYSSDSYRYGFNGMEKDNEIKGNGNSYTTEWRQYDPRLARWMSVDPLERDFPSHSPYHFAYNNPLSFTDDGGDSPISVLAKLIIKQGAKAALKSYGEKYIKRRLQKYMKGNLKHMSKDLARDLDDVLSTLDSEWWEVAIELIPVAGDVYGATKFGKRIAGAYSKMQKLENKYVEKIYNALPPGERARFKKNMRKAGVRDAKRDQRRGINNGETYTGDGTVDGHHIESVLDNPGRMTDPSNIRMMKRKDHMDLHRGEVGLPELNQGNTLPEVEIGTERVRIPYDKPTKAESRELDKISF